MKIPPDVVGACPGRRSAVPVPYGPIEGSRPDGRHPLGHASPCADGKQRPRRCAQCRPLPTATPPSSTTKPFTRNCLFAKAAIPTSPWAPPSSMVRPDADAAPLPSRTSGRPSGCRPPARPPPAMAMQRTLLSTATVACLLVLAAVAAYAVVAHGRTYMGSGLPSRNGPNSLELQRRAPDDSLSGGPAMIGFVWIDKAVADMRVGIEGPFPRVLSAGPQAHWHEHRQSNPDSDHRSYVQHGYGQNAGRRRRHGAPGTVAVTGTTAGWRWRQAAPVAGDARASEGAPPSASIREETLSPTLNPRRPVTTPSPSTTTSRPSAATGTPSRSTCAYKQLVTPNGHTPSPNRKCMHGTRLSLALYRAVAAAFSAPVRGYVSDGTTRKDSTPHTVHPRTASRAPAAATVARTERTHSRQKTWSHSVSSPKRRPRPRTESWQRAQMSAACAASSAGVKAGPRLPPPPPPRPPPPPPPCSRGEPAGGPGATADGGVDTSDGDNHPHASSPADAADAAIDGGARPPRRKGRRRGREAVVRRPVRRRVARVQAAGAAPTERRGAKAGGEGVGGVDPTAPPQRRANAKRAAAAAAATARSGANGAAAAHGLTGKPPPPPPPPPGRVDQKSRRAPPRRPRPWPPQWPRVCRLPGSPAGAPPPRRHPPLRAARAPPAARTLPRRGAPRAPPSGGRRRAATGRRGAAAAATARRPPTQKRRHRRWQNPHTRRRSRRPPPRPAGRGRPPPPRRERIVGRPRAHHGPVWAGCGRRRRPQVVGQLVEVAALVARRARAGRVEAAARRHDRRRGARHDRVRRVASSGDGRHMADGHGAAAAAAGGGGADGSEGGKSGDNAAEKRDGGRSCRAAADEHRDGQRAWRTAPRDGGDAPARDGPPSPTGGRGGSTAPPVHPQTGAARRVAASRTRAAAPRRHGRATPPPGHAQGRGTYRGSKEYTAAGFLPRRLTKKR
ncbi:LOW QUALITY PROTEIN: hypothetical protein BU14_0171s0006 [Porphyra umbilicalis]|uniref:Uncharacterized protein n=1 Tax=Porphyra umbilicalis TaxID=2786 RepID=A0A1X6P7Q9_PORUM|nr:LOW QUALITY PROTEIN: hypothetical protein BU14_0171s0006 [Porphyra umbilicalis]|eukprot:OSX76857.1 LOW QUALITY PROTEIN: hypothetical protein BU14_0171s0006 [Porphyra umbilicalis]